MLLLQYVLAFAVALAVSAGILPAVIRLAHRMGAVDAPGGRRAHSHGEIPRLGGIGIFLGFVAGVGVSMLLAGRASSLGDPSSDFPWIGAGIGATIMFAAGLMDDFWQFSARTKLLFQLLAAAVPVAFGVGIDSLAAPVGEPFALGSLSPVVTLLWILVVTNAMNLIDGLDGLAGGLALIVTTTMAFIALGLGHFGVVICAVRLAGALIGFLRYNFNPARIFMGDGGSQFLGFVLAIISIRGSAKSATAVALALPLLVLGLPLVDLITTILRRTFRNEAAGPLTVAGIVRRVASADREHLHHNLIDRGWSPRRAVLALYLVASFFALAGYLSQARSSLPIALLLLLVCVAWVAFVKIALRATPSLSEPPAGP